MAVGFIELYHPLLAHRRRPALACRIFSTASHTLSWPLQGGPHWHPAPTVVHVLTPWHTPRREKLFQTWSQPISSTTSKRLLQTVTSWYLIFGRLDKAWLSKPAPSARFVPAGGAGWRGAVRPCERVATCHAVRACDAWAKPGVGTEVTKGECAGMCVCVESELASCASVRSG